MKQKKRVRNLSIVMQWLFASLAGYSVPIDPLQSAIFAGISMLFMGMFLANHEMILKGE